MSSSRVVIVLAKIFVLAMIAIILLCIGICIVDLIHPCIVGWAFRRSLRSNRRGVSSVSPTSSSTVNGGGVVSGGGIVTGNNNGGMSEKNVQKLPLYKHGERELVAMEECDKHNCSVNTFYRTECVVCLDGYERGDTCRVLPMCRHSFHAKCVDAWLHKNPMCPVCRTSAEQQDCGEELKEELELRSGGDFSFGIGGGGGSGLYQVSETPNTTLPGPVLSSPADD